MSNILYIVRHQESYDNFNSTIQGPNNDSALTNSGIESAKLLSKYIIFSGISRIISSPYTRARETAEYLNSEIKVPIFFDDKLIEFNPGVLSGKNKKNIPHNLEQYLRIWNLRGDLDEIPQAEKGDELQARVVAFLNRYNSFDNKTELIVSHAGFNKCLINTIKRLPRTTPINVSQNHIEIIKNPLINITFEKQFAFNSENYKVITADKTFILKISLKKSLDDLKFEDLLSKELEKSKIIPKILYYESFENKSTQVLDYIDGNHRFNLTEDESKNIIRSTINLEKLLYTVSHKLTPKLKEKIISGVWSLEDSEIKEIGKKYIQSYRFNQILNPENQCLVHSDLHLHNILFKDDKIKFLDLESINLGPKNYSLANLITSTFLLNSPNDFNLETFINNYNIPINIKDLAILMQIKALIGGVYFQKDLSVTNEFSGEKKDLLEKYIKAIKYLNRVINNG